jgi:hypothetical protein
VLKILRIWLPFALVITALSGLIYLLAQQSLRLSANDPQIQLAQDAAEQVDHGISPTALIPSDQIEISQSLYPFIMVFDSQGNLTSSSALLDGNPPHFPSNVFDYVKNHGEDRLTWQPRPGARFAVVVESFKNNQNTGFLVVGRSLREVENRTDNLLKITAVTWLITLILTFLAIYFFYPKSKTR